MTLLTLEIVTHLSIQFHLFGCHREHTVYDNKYDLLNFLIAS